MGLDRRALSAEELAGTDRVLDGLQDELGQQLAKLLTAEEIASLARALPVCVWRGSFRLQAVGCRQCPGRCSEEMHPAPTP